MAVSCEGLHALRTAIIARARVTVSMFGTQLKPCARTHGHGCILLLYLSFQQVVSLLSMQLS